MVVARPWVPSADSRVPNMRRNGTLAMIGVGARTPRPRCGVRALRSPTTPPTLTSGAVTRPHNRLKQTRACLARGRRKASPRGPLPAGWSVGRYSIPMTDPRCPQRIASGRSAWLGALPRGIENRSRCRDAGRARSDSTWPGQTDVVAAAARTRCHRRGLPNSSRPRSALEARLASAALARSRVHTWAATCASTHTRGQAVHHDVEVELAHARDGLARLGISPVRKVGSSSASWPAESSFSFSAWVLARWRGDDRLVRGDALKQNRRLGEQMCRRCPRP